MDQVVGCVNVWTPAIGAARLVDELGEDTALGCLGRLVTGEVPPSDLESPPWPLVVTLISGGKLPSFDFASPQHGYWPRSWAARALAYVGDEDAAPWLAAALEDGHWRVRMTAAQSIGRLGIRGVEPQLLARLRDPHQRVRAAAVTTLGRVGGDAVVPRLEEMLEDESELVQDRTLVALRRVERDP